MNSSMRQTENQYEQSRKPLQSGIKRMIDILISVMALFVLSPFLIILIILIAAEDGLPVFFTQQRSGKDDTKFDMYKFRSMKKVQTFSVEHPERNYNWKNGVPDDFVFKLTNANAKNPNITRIGAFIRKYSLDELPQLVNVLKGDMSIVGPRPEIIEISRCYNAEQQQRLIVKPGITGWAQTNGRSDMNHGKKIEHDLYYVRNFSLWLDTKIIVKTITQVFGGEGSV